MFVFSAAGAVFHIHSQNAVMVTLLFPGKEFQISHQQMIKAIVNCKTGRNYRLTLFSDLINNGIVIKGCKFYKPVISLVKIAASYQIHTRGHVAGNGNL